MALKSSVFIMPPKLSGSGIRRRPSQDKVENYKHLIYSKAQLKKLAKRCRSISEGWAVEVAILYGYSGKRASLYDKVNLAFNGGCSMANTARVVEVARWYVDHQPDAIRKLRAILKEQPERYQL